MLILFAVVWRHAHWSVALCLTLQGLAIETTGLIRAMKARHERLRAQALAAALAGQQEAEQKKFWTSFEPK